MKIYRHQTDALRAILLMWTQGYRNAIVFEARDEKLDSLAEKFAETYGTELPAWKRYERKRKKLPNAWACSMPKSSYPGHNIVVLMAAFETLEHLDPSSPWKRENWRPAEKIEIGDYRIAPDDRRDRRDHADTIKLTTRTMAGLESYWRSLASQGQFDKIADEALRAVQFYALFGGVRRQLRRLIRGYQKLYQARLKKPWPGPNPEALPSVGSFRSASEDKAGKKGNEGSRA
jgi:hypothetical protein